MLDSVSDASTEVEVIKPDNVDPMDLVGVCDVAAPIGPVWFPRQLANPDRSRVKCKPLDPQRRIYRIIDVAVRDGSLRPDQFYESRMIPCSAMYSSSPGTGSAGTRWDCSSSELPAFGFKRGGDSIRERILLDGTKTPHSKRCER